MAARSAWVLLPFLVLTACTGSKEEHAPGLVDASPATILLGGGADTDLSRALERGSLGEGGVFNRSLGESGLMAPATPRLESRTPPHFLPDLEEPMVEDSELVSEEAPGWVPGQEELRSQGKRQPASAPERQAWRQGDRRPSFARVYVGDGNSLELLRMRVTVTIDGPRARTVVDHVFRNPHDRVLEGTFEYPLPADASVCYYAMFLSGEQREIPPFFAQELPGGVLADMAPDRMARSVDIEHWGPLREARVVARHKARQIYEEIVRRDIDPALLEYAGGNTFRGRVFPIAAKGLNRVIVAYEETLEGVDERLRYRFPLPECALEVLTITASLEASAIQGDAWSPKPGAERRLTAGRIVWEQAWEQTTGPGGKAELSFEPADPRVQVVSGPGPAAGRGCFLARLRPELPETELGAGARAALFLLDTSLSEYPQRFNVSLELLQRILEADERMERFNVLCFDVGAWWIEPNGWIENGPSGRKRALEALNEILLEGATDLGTALELLARTGWAGQPPEVDLFLLTDGQVNWGEREPARMLAAFEAAFPAQARFFCYRTGLGAENLELFSKLTRRGGGIFNVFGEKQAEQAALAHRRACFLIDSVAVEGAGDLLLAGRQAALFPGGELLLAGSFAEPGAAEAVVRGRIGGEARTYRFPLALGRESALAARAWAEIAIAQLLELGDPEPERLAVALSQHYRVGSRVASFLVLEQDQDYVQFGIEEEAGALEASDLGLYLERRYSDWLGPVSPRERFVRDLDLLDLPPKRTKAIKDLLVLLSDQELALPAGPDPGSLPPSRGLAESVYLDALNAHSRKPEHFLVEAARRADEGADFLGMRALSSLIELFPGRADAGRLAGYRLLAMDLPGPAAMVFDSVRQGRPFEPHSYRDLGRSLALTRNYSLAALYYEVVLAGSWHRRFHDSLLVIARDEYCRLMQDALREQAISARVAERFGERLEDLHQAAGQADLRVTITWNTDGTDVDLWVHEPGGEACGYSNPQTKNGGRLLDDLTQGYGPERYEIHTAPPGEYVILVHYFSANPNLLAGETHVDVLVSIRPGRKDEQNRRFHVVLTREKQGYEVCRVRL